MNDNLILTPEDAALLVKGVGSRSPWADLNFDGFGKLWSRIESHAKQVPPPLNGDKVWNGTPTWPASVVSDGTTHNQVHTVVRAKSKAEAKRMMHAAGNPQGSRFDTHWSECGNREGLCAAIERGVWAKSSKGWVKVWPKGE